MPTLLLYDNSIPALVSLYQELARIGPTDSAAATASAARTEPVINLAVTSEVRDRAGEPLETLCGLTGARVVDVPQTIDSPSGAPARLATSAELLSAAALALSLGCETLVWPIHTTESDGTEAAGAAFDRAFLVEQLVALDAGSPAAPKLCIETPMLEIADAAVVDLGIDLGAPMELATRCRKAPDPACGVCPSCARWQAAAELVGLRWIASPISA